MGRIAMLILALAVAASSPVAGLLDARGQTAADLAVKRDDDLWVLAVDDDDDDGDDSNSWSSGVDSNDRSNSRRTGVSRDRDRSRDDLTRDRTRDGAGTSQRDWSQNRTNDRSRNDTR